MRTTRAIGLTLASVPLMMGIATAATAQSTGTEVARPASFTSAFRVDANATQVPADDQGNRGNTAATGVWDLQINADQEIICFDITVDGINPPYESPAMTATHIHQGAPGEVGGAKVLFPNPEMTSNGTYVAEGCLLEPFNDPAFSFATLEAGPIGFYVDTHTSAFPRGDVRGQFSSASLPVGGVATGGGGTALSAEDDGNAAMLAAGLLLAATGAGVARQFRRGTS